MLTHRALRFNALNVAAALELSDADEVLANGPLFNPGPMNILTTPALGAGATVTMLRELDPGATLEAIERHAITLAISAPAQTKALVSHPDRETTDLSSLRCVVTGSTNVREDVLAPWFARGVCVLRDYGLTETMPVVTVVSLRDAHRLRHTAGRPVPPSTPETRRRRRAAAHADRQGRPRRAAQARVAARPPPSTTTRPAREPAGGRPGSLTSRRGRGSAADSRSERAGLSAYVLGVATSRGAATASRNASSSSMRRSHA